MRRKDGYYYTRVLNEETGEMLGKRFILFFQHMLLPTFTNAAGR